MATVESAERLVSLPTVIETRLQDVRRRESRLRLLTGLVDATAIFLVVMLVALICDWAFTLFSTEVRLVLSLGSVAAGAVGLLLLAFLPQLKRRTLSEVAADVDRSVSELQERWQTVAELSSSNDPRQVAGSPAMARRVVREAIARERLVDSQAVVTTETLKKHQWFLVAAIAAHVVLYVVDAPQAWVLLQRFLLPTSNVSLTQVTAAGGNIAVPHGEPVRFEANLARRNHENAELFLRDAGGKVSTISLKSADKAGSKFVYGIDAADNGFEYRFRAGDGETPWHTVSVHERPTFSKIDFRIVAPEYTKLPVVEKQELPGKIRAIEGSQLEIVFTADQPLSQFRLDFGKDESTMLQPSATDPQKYLYQTKLDKTIRLTPVMTSKFGLENVHPPSCQIVVYPDRAPQVQIKKPDNEITVRPDDQVEIEIAARDDLGIVEAEVIAYVGDAPDMENAVVVEPGVETPVTTNVMPEEPMGINTMEDLINAIQDATQPAADPNSLKIDTSTTEPTTSDANATPAAEGTTEPAKDAPPTKPGDTAQSTTSKPTEGSTNSKPSTDSKPSGDAKPTTDGKPSTDSKASDANSKSGNNDEKAKKREGNAQNPAEKNAQSNSDPSSPSNPQDAKPNANSSNSQANDKPGTNSANNNASTGANQDSSQASPPQTVRMQIPLGNEKGEKNVRGKVLLDLKQFKLKTGQQIQYKVVVKDTKNSIAQNRDRNAVGAESPNMLAQNDPSRNAQQTDPATGLPANAPNAADNAQNPNDPSATQNANANSNPDAKTSASNNSAQSNRNAQANAAQSRQNGGSMNDAQKMQNAKSAQGSQNVGDPADPASRQNANGDGNSNNRNNNANPNDSSSASSSQASRNSKNSDQKQPESQGSMTGAPQPPNSMDRRELDVEQQSTSSSTMKIHIDEWAGSFKGQQREKLEILIDPILKELDAVLAKSLEHMNPAADVLKQGKPLDDSANKSLKAADTQIERGQTLVADLVKKTNETPYAFVGLQLVDITEVHVVPARGELKAVSTDAADKQKTHVEQAQFHVIRAREMLVNLTKKYEEAKQNAKLADKMERIRKMYQIFVEDSMAFLAASRDTLNPKNRKIAELELDEEFLEKYTELQKEWNEILKQLAKALSEDPRLLERYMNVNRKSAQTLRDQLTVINQRQQLLVPVTDRLMGKNAEQAKAEKEKESEKPDGKDQKKEQPTAAEVVKGSLQQDLIEVSEKASEIHEDFKAWLPKTMKADDERIAPLIQQSTQLATVAEQAAATASLKSLETAAKKVTELNTQMAEFEQGLSKLSGDSDAALAANANRRLAALRRLQLRTSAWAEKNANLSEGKLNRAVELDQHRVSEETLELAGKLDGLQAQFAGLPDDILELAGSLQEILRFDALVDQMQAELTLRDNDLPVARDHQQNAAKNLTRAEEAFDKLIDRVIEEQDKVPPDVPDVDQMQLQTLEELLAQLEAERDLADELGIPNRPTNLQQFRDWMMRNGGSGGAGTAGSQRVQMARLNALRALQNANVPQGANLSTKKAGRWNTLSSRLEDILRQGRGKLPPKQYQRAINQYFDDISGAEGSEGPAK